MSVACTIHNIYTAIQLLQHGQLLSPLKESSTTHSLLYNILHNLLVYIQSDTACVHPTTKPLCCHNSKKL